MTLGTEAMRKQWSSCSAPELVVGADDVLTWGLVFDLGDLGAPGGRDAREHDRASDERLAGPQGRARVSRAVRALHCLARCARNSRWRTRFALRSSLWRAS